MPCLFLVSVIFQFSLKAVKYYGSIFFKDKNILYISNDQFADSTIHLRYTLHVFKLSVVLYLKVVYSQTTVITL